MVNKLILFHVFWQSSGYCRAQVRDCRKDQVQQPVLTRFWFKTAKGYGIGVTAYSLDDAKNLISNIDGLVDANVISVIADVDIRTLDQGHVIPNMGPPNLRGVWFPNFSNEQ